MFCGVPKDRTSCFTMTSTCFCSPLDHFTRLLIEEPLPAILIYFLPYIKTKGDSLKLKYTAVYSSFQLIINIIIILNFTVRPHVRLARYPH